MYTRSVRSLHICALTTLTSTFQLCARLHHSRQLFCHDYRLATISQLSLPTLLQFLACLQDCVSSWPSAASCRWCSGMVAA